MSDFDDESTPPKGKILRPLTDSERQVFAAQWDSSHKGVVRGEFEDEETSPIDLFERDPKDAEEAIIRHLRRDPKRLIEYVGKIAAKAQQLSTEFRRRIVHESSENQRQLDDLRLLLSQPPNGATKRIEEQLRALSLVVDRLADRTDTLESRVEPVEATVTGAKKAGWKAIGAVALAFVGSGGAVYRAMAQQSEERGRLLEKINAQDRDIERLQRNEDARRDRPPRRDYDYDIQPRHEPAAKKDAQP